MKVFWQTIDWAVSGYYFRHRSYKGLPRYLEVLQAIKTWGWKDWNNRWIVR